MRQRFFQRLCTVASLFALSACTTSNPYYKAARPHHTPDGFRNNYAADVTNPFSQFVRWQIERYQQKLPRPATQPTPTQSPDMAAIQGYANRSDTAISTATAKTPAITWIGHASMMVQAGGLTVLTDPVFSERASPVQFAGPKRAQPPGLALADLPLIDVVLISHNHYDHLDKASVRDIAERSAAAGKPTLFLVPLGLKPWFADAGISNVIELDWWDQHSVSGVEFYFTPTQHWSARGVGDRSRTLWGSFAVFAPELHWFFAGDTGYSKDFADIQAHFANRQLQAGGFDLALIPVGGYQPRWFMASQHIDPQEAVQIHRDLQAKRSVAIHWGVFELTDEALDQPPKDLAVASKKQQLKADEFTVMAIGETRFLPARPPP